MKWTGLILVLLACNRPMIHTERVVETIKKDSLVYLPSSEVTKTIVVDTLDQERWYSKIDSLQKAQLFYMRDRLGRLQLAAKCPPDTIIVQNTVTKETNSKVITVEVKSIPWYIWALIGLLCLIVVLLILSRL